MFRALINWMDRDWASRKFSPVFPFAQRLIWSVPMFLSIALISVLDAFGVARDSTVSLTVFAMGGIGTFAVMLISFYRWAMGYSRSEFQDQAAAEHRAQGAERQELLRRWFKRNGS